MWNRPNHESKPPQSGKFAMPGEPSVHLRIASALDDWASRHPNPDAPAVSLGGLGDYSPRELAHAVSEKSEAGQFFEALIVSGAQISGEGLDGVLRSFRDEGGNTWIEAGAVVAEGPGAASVSPEAAHEETGFRKIRL
jgi:hypothetical protein